MNTDTTNGRARKTLASQIDRLDNMLDGLSEGIQGTVTLAVEQAVTKTVREAVQATLIEVLTNAELQQRLHAAQVLVSEPATPRTNRILPVLRSGLGWVTGLAKGAWNLLVSVAHAAFGKFGDVTREGAVIVRAGGRHNYQRLLAAMHCGWLATLALCVFVRDRRKPVLISLAVGLVIGIFCYLTGAAVAAAVSSVTSVLLSMGALTLERTSKLLGMDGPIAPP